MRKRNRIYDEPDVTVFVPCPNCRRLLSPDLLQCPSCCELIDDEQRYTGALYTVVTTQAVSVANNIATFDPAIVLLLLATSYGFVSGFGSLVPLFVSTGGMALYGAGRWLVRYGRLPISEPDFVAARRRMRRSFAMWSAFVFFEIALGIFLVVRFVANMPPNER